MAWPRGSLVVRLGDNSEIASLAQGASSAGNEGPSGERREAQKQKGRQQAGDGESEFAALASQMTELTHSLRRLADTTARRYRAETDTTADMIDLYFGWQERVLKKAIQVHCATLSIIERMWQAWITGMM